MNAPTLNEALGARGLGCRPVVHGTRLTVFEGARVILERVTAHEVWEWLADADRCDECGSHESLTVIAKNDEGDALRECDQCGHQQSEDSNAPDPEVGRAAMDAFWAGVRS